MVWAMARTLRRVQSGGPRRCQATQQRDGRGAHRPELGHDIAQRAISEVGGGRIVFELDPCPHDGIGARDAERAVGEDALDVAHVPDDFKNIPLRKPRSR